MDKRSAQSLGLDEQFPVPKGRAVQRDEQQQSRHLAAALAGLRCEHVFEELVEAIF